MRVAADGSIQSAQSILLEVSPQAWCSGLSLRPLVIYAAALPIFDAGAAYATAWVQCGGAGWTGPTCCRLASAARR